MSSEKNFTDREAFEQILSGVRTATGAPYQDVATIYGDLSRLVVGLLATNSPQRLQEIYAQVGWGGNANVRALHEAAKHWYEIHHPGRNPPVGASAG
ncbi:hypothetical protein [Arenimonas metalli]|uniref:hypothetical protein n=1 Tax=Arenimonas metalli TaxID=948077 RepID=UPI0012EBA731|nr:hypothetical protein [Arenimonas metalli]